MNRHTARIAGSTAILLLVFGGTLYWIATTGPLKSRKKADRILTVLPQSQPRRSPLARDTVRIDADVNLAADSRQATSEHLLRAAPDVFDSVKVFVDRNAPINREGPLPRFGSGPSRFTESGSAFV